MANKVMHHCRKCQQDTEHWDNRNNKRNPKAPDFKCIGCGNGVWEKPFAPPQTTPKQPALAPYKPQNGRNYEEEGVKKGACAIVVAIIHSGVYKDLTQDERNEKIYEDIVFHENRYRTMNPTASEMGFNG